MGRVTHTTNKQKLKAKAKVGRECAKALEQMTPEERRPSYEGKLKALGIAPIPDVNPLTGKRFTAREKAELKAKQVEALKDIPIQEARKRKAARDEARALPIRLDVAAPGDPDVVEAEPVDELGPEPSNSVGGQKLSMTERRVVALNMRIVGHDYRVIARELSVSVKTAYADVQEALVYLSKYERVLAERIRDLELARLDAMQTLMWPAVERADPFAAQAFLKIMERRARLLGLDAPVQIDMAQTTRPHRSIPLDELKRRTEQRLLASASGNGNGHGAGAQPLTATPDPDTSGWSDHDPENDDPDSAAAGPALPDGSERE